MKNYLNTFIVLLTLVISTQVKSQQDIFVNAYYENLFMINPAFTGYGLKPSIFFMHQNTLVAFPGSPVAQLVAIDGKLKNQNMNIGLKLYNEKINFISASGGFLSFGYRMNINNDHFLRLGISLGITQQSILFDKLNAASPSDAVLLNTIDKKPILDGDFGIGYHYKSKIAAGLTVQKLFGNRVVYTNNLGVGNLNYRMLREYKLFAQYTHTFKNEQFSVRPIFTAVSIEGLPFWYNIAAHLIYKNNYTLGFGYKVNTAITSVVGIKIDNRFTVNYSFDYGVNNKAEVKFTSHEIILGYNFGGDGNKEQKKNTTPKMSDIDIKQFEQLDQLEEEAKRLKERADSIAENVRKQKEQIDSHTKELEELKKSAEEYKKEVEVIIAENETKTKVKAKSKPKPKAKSTATADKPIDGYYIVMGAFKVFENAKRHQALLDRAFETNTLLIQNKERTYYFVCYKKVDNLSAAQKEVKRINELQKVKQLIVGANSCWIYVKEK